MKKILFIALFLLPLMSSGQITWGVKGGANISSIGGISVATTILRVHGGFYYQQRLEQQYGLTAELLYSMQGARSSTTQGTFISYNYLNLPILFKIYFQNDVYFETGPQFGYLLATHVHDNGDKLTNPDPGNKFDLTYLAGLGKATDFGNYGARAGFGLTNTNGAPGLFNVQSRNMLFQIYVAYSLGQLN